MATHTDTLARIYARSLFELSDESGGHTALQESADELDQICELIRDDRKLAEFMSSPLIEMSARRTTLEKIFSGRISDLILRFIQVLNTNGRLGHLPQITAAFSQMVNHALGRVEIDVATPTPMDDATRADLARRLQETFGKEPVLHTSVDPSLIGGLTLRVGDQLVDGSVASQLRRLESDLQQAGGHAIRIHPDQFMTAEGGETA